MARLIFLNGPPAAGKSTLAEMYVAQFPLSLNLDIDRIRDLIGDWKSEPSSSGLLARSIALAAARTHLSNGHDVVVPQLVRRGTFIDECAAVAEAAEASFHEIAVMCSPESSRSRFLNRESSIQERDVDIKALHDDLMSFLKDRTAAIVNADETKPDATFLRLLALVLDG